MFSLLSTLYRVPLQNRWKFFWIYYSNFQECHDPACFFIIVRDFNEVGEKKLILFEKSVIVCKTLILEVL